MLAVSQTPVQNQGALLRRRSSFSALRLAARLGLTGWCISALTVVGTANATLGQAPSAPPLTASPTSSVAKILATSSKTRNELYTRHELQLENGTLVQEFATLDGVVFAVVWRGPVLPDLSTLLGAHFARFKQETDQARRLGKRGSPANLVSDKLIVSSGGRMRGFHGHAYVPALIPVGLSIRDVLS